MLCFPLCGFCSFGSKVDVDLQQLTFGLYASLLKHPIIYFNVPIKISFFVSHFRMALILST